MQKEKDFLFMLDYLPFINKRKKNVPINENNHARKKNDFLFYARLSPLHNRNKWKKKYL